MCSFRIPRRVRHVVQPIVVGLLLMVVGVIAVPSSVRGAQEGQEEGVILGRVVVRRPSVAAERPAVSSLATSPRRDPDDTSRAVVYLESAPRRAFDQPEGGRVTMDQRNETFVPHLLAVMVGTTVDFPNSDRTYHNVFSLSRTARFDLGRYATGRSKAVRFDRAGIVRVFCDIHSHMNAFILVFSHPYFAVTDAGGRYVIRGMPPGRYSVVAWHEGVVSEARSVTVTGQSPTELDFSLR